mgnify:FL=1
MKTAISIPDAIFREAEAVAQRLGISRSELYAKAVDSFIAAQRNEGVTELLNRVYSTESSAVDAVLSRLQVNSLPHDEW